MYLVSVNSQGFVKMTKPRGWVLSKHPGTP